MDSYKQALSFLGLLRRGRGLYLGDEAKGKKAALVVVAKDAKTGSYKSAREVAGKLGVPLIEASSKEELGAALGKAEVAYLSIKEGKAAKAFLAKLDERRN